MKNVFIKYNPYKLETELTVEGKELAQNSQIGEHILPGSRLQEWVEELPQNLIDEYNDTEFNIVFHGTLPDFEDLTEVFTQAVESGMLTASFERIPAKETDDKEALIDEVFESIKNGPFDEFRDEEIISAFENAKSSDFEVCVVATMSAGKSTLINSMLGAKLMPSKQEACTAIITKIKDIEVKNDCESEPCNEEDNLAEDIETCESEPCEETVELNDDIAAWKAKVYGKDDKLIETHESLTYETMERLNGDENVSVIKVEGNIPFVSAEDVSLVLIDTPGPNNSRDPEHRRVQSEFLKKSSKSLVLYIMEGTFGSDDDNALLQRVAESMKVGGKQSKDRFIFVINKMDDRRAGDGETSQTLDRIRGYLKMHGITNPNLFPAAALPALDIRLINSGADVDVDTVDETEMKVRKLNRNANFHFEKYAPLPKSIRDDINEQLEEAKNNEDANAEALIHTGIVSIEAAIRQYVQKYAKTAKIKNIVDTFMHKLEEVGCFEETKRELAKNKENCEIIAEQIALIRKKVDDVKLAQNFSNRVDEAVDNVCDNATKVIEDIVSKYQEKISQILNDLSGKELTIEEANQEVSNLENFAKKLEPDFQADLDELISESLITTCNALLDEYKNKLASLTSEIDISELKGINIDPLKLMSGTMPNANNFAVNDFIATKKVKEDEIWVKNTSKKWWKPWTWGQESGYYKAIYKDVEYVPADELAQGFFAPIEENLYENGEQTKKYAINQANRVAKVFNLEFEKLDDLLKNKLSELESYAVDKEQAEKRIKEAEERLKWLKEIEESVSSILDI